MGLCESVRVRVRLNANSAAAHSRSGWRRPLCARKSTLSQSSARSMATIVRSESRGRRVPEDDLADSSGYWCWATATIPTHSITNSTNIMVNAEVSNIRMSISAPYNCRRGNRIGHTTRRYRLRQTPYSGLVIFFLALSRSPSPRRGPSTAKQEVPLHFLCFVIAIDDIHARALVRLDRLAQVCP